MAVVVVAVGVWGAGVRGWVVVVVVVRGLVGLVTRPCRHFGG